MNQPFPQRFIPYLILAGVLDLLLIGGLAYLYWSLKTDYLQLTNEQASLTAKLAEAERILATTSDALFRERDINSSFAGEIADIVSTVGVLDKLSKTDRELLQKYSKVYFLNENYIPSKLTIIDPVYLVDNKKTQHIHSSVWPELEDLLEDAAENDIDLRIVSAYRSFGTQVGLKANYVVTFGAGTANRFSAEQGYSEHQLGTTVDFSTPTLGQNFAGFDKTEAYAWLEKYAHRYGFTPSYPPGNVYYQYEPWHWRFVGVKLATSLHREKKYFYDLDQREIDTYLVNIFD